MQKKFSLWVATEDGAPTHLSRLLECSETSRARKLIFGMQVNIDKANTLPVRGTRKKCAIRTSVYCMYIFCEIKFRLNGISMLVPVQWLSMDKHK